MRLVLRTTSLSLSLAALAGGLLVGLPSSVAEDGPPGQATHASPERARAPRLRVRTLVRGLEHPWDVQQGPGGRLLVSERDRARISVVRHGRRRTLADLSASVWVSGETGLMSLAVDPQRRVVWACHGSTTSDGHDVRVTRWRVDPTWRRLVGPRILAQGFPATSGRHGGCRLLLARGSNALSSAPATPRPAPTRATSTPWAARSCASTATPAHRSRAIRTPTPRPRAASC